MSTRPSYAKRLKAVSKVSEAIVSNLYLEDILSLITTVTAEVMGSKICSLMLLDEESRELVVRATHSISEEFYEAYNQKPNLKTGEGIAGKVVEENCPRVVADVTKEKDYKYKEMARKEGLVSLLCVPLSVKGKVIGALTSYTSSVHKFAQSEIDILTTVANQAAMAIENANLMVKTRIIAEELETRKLVEKAKGVLMKDRGFSEDEAYKRIQQQSMNRRKSMREIAEAIILTKEIERRD
ncbi:GAF and ANTAR domain-containing protein [bacterium]|nr:GAF and ANTAR domain-containing protein [bacterium]MBU1613877.1 GAF and ANTAR domain-containing protein [bacterium]